MRSVLFDVDGVLIDGFHARPERRHRWDRNLRKDLGIEPGHFSESFIAGPFVNDVLPGKQSLVDALAGWLPAQGYTLSPMTVIRYWLAEDSRCNAELLALIRHLRPSPRCRLYIATNQEHLRAMHLWSALGFHELFDDMFYAARLGVLKPGARFFERIELLMGRQDEPPLFFDDDEQVVEAARAFGWDAILYDRLQDCAEHPFIASILQGT